MIVKEAMDNALDACEEAGTAPKIHIKVDSGGIIVADNGPGIPARTIDGILDFSVRASSREAYVSPTRGAQGNALQTVLAMPFVLDGGRVAERYDIAIMSTKGMPVVACRQLADALCGPYGIPLLVLHDFDKSGFSILGTLRGVEKLDRNLNPVEQRYEYRHDFEVIDLGLRLEDVEEYALESEVVRYRGRRSDPRKNLEANGATEEEIAFLYSGYGQGQRVELNAFASDVFVRWIESKLQANGIKKVIPDQETLREAFRRAIQLATIKEQLPDIIEEAAREAQEATIPKGLKTKVARALKANPEIPWDRAIADLAAEDL